MAIDLNSRIRNFYDTSTPLWLDVWGEHMHHGYYGPDGKASKNDRQAQLDLMEALLGWGGVEGASHILDAGCGVGGSARFLARRFGSRVYGLTLSPVQARRARQYNEAAGLARQIDIEVRDMLSLGAGDGPFDLIWSLESAEHIADKTALMKLFYERLAPGGRLLMATWCRRPLPPPLSGAEKRMLDRIYRWYHLPPMIAMPELAALAREAGFSSVQTDDWSRAVAPFWGAVIRSAIHWRSLLGLFRAGWSTWRGAWAMQYMQRGFREQLIQFAVLQASRHDE